LKILSAEFVTSAAAGGAAAGIPREGVPPFDRQLRAALSGVEAPQIAFAGRSNVGKSSLINALCRRKIARTSAAPGKTRLANVYRVTLEGLGAPGRRDLYLVDLPGYGYARGGADAAKELALVAAGYFAASKGPVPLPRAQRSDARPKPRAACVSAALLLVDARHPGLELDVQAHAWLRGMGAEPYLLAAKIDKLSRAERARNLRVLGDMFETAALPVSAESGEGLDELWRLISRATAADPRR
jgi:GTP-binding protein